MTFGSSEKQVGRVCEQFILATMSWKRRPDMHKARSSFTPAVWQAAVYLCGGFHNSTIETFDGHSMKQIKINLLEDDGAIACPTKTHLLIIGHRFIYFLQKPAKSAVLSLTYKSRSASRPLQLSATPVVWKDQIVLFHVGVMTWDSEDIEVNSTEMYSTVDGGILF